MSSAGLNREVLRAWADGSEMDTAPVQRAEPSAIISESQPRVDLRKAQSLSPQEIGASGGALASIKKLVRKDLASQRKQVPPLWRAAVRIIAIPWIGQRSKPE